MHDGTPPEIGKLHVDNAAGAARCAIHQSTEPVAENSLPTTPLFDAFRLLDHLVARLSSPALAGFTQHHSNFAGDENGLVASTTNITRALRSLMPPLETCMVVPATCPGIACPASICTTPEGVFCSSRPLSR